MEKKNAIVGNLELFYFDNEASGRPLFFIHGNSLNSGLFYRQFEDAALGNYRIIAPDLPGHGRSSRSTNPEKGYSVKNYIQLLAEFTNKLQLEDIILFGHSLGGHIAINLSNELAGKISGLAIMGTPPLTVPPKMEEAFLPNPALAYAFKPDLSDEELKQLSSAFINEEQNNFELLKSAIITADPLVRPFIGKSISTEVTDEVSILQNSDFPLAVFHGRKDKLVNADYISNLGLDLHSKEVYYIENAGHAAFLENHQEFNRALSEFVSTV
ncbi:MAG: alpha/beta fold hydrolase [Bacteroidota bacterium]